MFFVYFIKCVEVYYVVKVVLYFIGRVFKDLL